MPLACMHVPRLTPHCTQAAEVTVTYEEAEKANDELKRKHEFLVEKIAEVKSE